MGIIHIKHKDGRLLEVLIDDDCFEQLREYNWRILESGSHITKYLYVIRSGRVFGLRRNLIMHREIMCLPFGDKREVDHINGNTLDNRKENLRVCSRSQNQHNGHQRHGASSYKGVHRNRSKWNASITLKGRPVRLGSFADEVDAARAYDRAAFDMFGVFANTNRLDE